MKIPTLSHTYYVLRAKGGCEHLAEEELRKGGLFGYVPMRRVRNFVRRQRLIVNHQKPLLPGYIFLGVEEGRPVEWGRLRDERHYRHVGRPLAGSCGPLKVPSAIVVQIHVDEVAGVFDETGSTKRQNHDKLVKRFKPGKKLRANEGPFSGFEAVVQGVTAQDRVKTLIEIFGRSVPVEFLPEQLEAA